MDPNLSDRPSSNPFKMLKHGINGNGNHARYLHKNEPKLRKKGKKQKMKCMGLEVNQIFATPQRDF